jgi:hypothetical protein
MTTRCRLLVANVLRPSAGTPRTVKAIDRPEPHGVQCAADASLRSTNNFRVVIAMTWKRAISAGFMGLLVPGAAVALAAPQQLYGKTVSVSWTEDIVRRVAGEETFQHKQHPRVAIIYIGSSGRPFIRIHTITRGGRGALEEQVGTSGKTTVGGSQTADFKDKSLTVVSVYQGGAQRIQIDFDGSYQSCTASVVVGKQAGAHTFTRLNGSNELTEVQSDSSSSATCTIESGNSFAR